jgi:pimeloyl-ACP methyl ester carboxylesterase
MLIYSIPGVAADPRIFRNLRLPVHELRHLELPLMEEDDTIRDQAMALRSSISEDVPHMILGMSMGGMIAQELASITSPHRVVIISSWKGPEEMPAPLKTMRGTHPERVLSEKLIDRILPFLFWQMGAESEDDRELIRSFVHTTPVEQIKRQIDASLNWDGPASPVKDLLHIHGDNDHLMPIGEIKDPIPVKEGGHIMVYNKAAEVSRAILDHLR